MPADAHLRVGVHPIIDGDILFTLADLGQKLTEAGQAFIQLAALLGPPEGETVDSMTVHFESAARPCPSQGVHQSHTWTPFGEDGLQVPCPGVRPGT